MNNEQRRYTAQELRDCAKGIFGYGIVSRYECSSARYGCKEIQYEEVKSMLSQAADAEDELAQLKASKERWMQYQETAAGERNACIDELRKKDAEIALLKARLYAVTKECETDYDMRCTGCPCEHNDACMLTCIQVERIVEKRQKDILRAARGEGGAE